MAVVKAVIEETREVCTLCRGSGQHVSSSQSTSVIATCPGCIGVGLMLTRTVRRTEEVDLDALTDAISQRMMDRLKSARGWPDRK